MSRAVSQAKIHAWLPPLQRLQALAKLLALVEQSDLEVKERLYLTDALRRVCEGPAESFDEAFSFRPRHGYKQESLGAVRRRLHEDFWLWQILNAAPRASIEKIAAAACGGAAGTNSQLAHVELIAIHARMLWPKVQLPKSTRRFAERLRTL